MSQTCYVIASRRSHPGAVTDRPGDPAARARSAGRRVGRISAAGEPAGRSARPGRSRPEERHAHAHPSRCIPSGPGARGRRATSRDRARGALLGLAVGDALGAPAENMKPSRDPRAAGAVSRASSPTTRPARTTPSTRSSPGCCSPGTARRSPSPMSRRPGTSGSPTATRARSGAPASASAARWRTCAGAWPPPSRPSTGTPGATAWPCARRPFGVFAAGRPAEAARLVAIDGTVSHDGEGIYGGQAVAAGVAGGDGGRADRRGGRRRAGRGPGRLLDRPLPAPRGRRRRSARHAGRPASANARCAPRWSSAATPGPTWPPRRWAWPSARSRRPTATSRRRS